MRSFLRQLAPAALSMGVMTVVLGLAYPLAVTGIAQGLFGDRADGSPIRVGEHVVGSRLLGQGFSDPAYFHPRPSAASDGYNGLAGSGSNLGPTNPDFLAAVAERVAAYRTENGLDPDVPVPVDAVTASGSGLDPHISVANARLQAGRVAAARGIVVGEVLALIDEHTDRPQLGFLNDAGVNVLELNLALDGP